MTSPKEELPSGVLPLVPEEWPRIDEAWMIRQCAFCKERDVSGYHLSVYAPSKPEGHEIIEVCHYCVAKSVLKESERRIKEGENKKK